MPKLARPTYIKFLQTITVWSFRHDYSVGTLDVLKACDACTDMASYSAVYRFCSLSEFPKLVICMGSLITGRRFLSVNSPELIVVGLVGLVGLVG